MNFPKKIQVIEIDTYRKKVSKLELSLNNCNLLKKFTGKKSLIALENNLYSIIILSTKELISQYEYDY